MFRRIRLAIILSGGFLFCADRLLKYLSAHNWPTDHLMNRFIGWHPYFNEGIAFGVPIANWLILAISIPLIILVIYLLSKETGLVSAGLWLVLFGAVSNFFDRAYYHHTLDYFLILTSIFNLADVMIVAGIGLCLLTMKRKESEIKI